ncbi:hypothetical protein [Caldivirga sp. UBA161]|uniref:hypothetical protein n=1 Tax=Caldivirga sp. UBA161 TaxID=1915569 RepID=UPI0025C62EC3|nr:hypothetical protein [Caldivirga sp. UBA161]
MGVRRFRPADGEVIERSVCVIDIEVQGISVHAIAVFGSDDVYLLGSPQLYLQFIDA